MPVPRGIAQIFKIKDAMDLHVINPQEALRKIDFIISNKHHEDRPFDDNMPQKALWEALRKIRDAFKAIFWRARSQDTKDCYATMFNTSAEKLEAIPVTLVQV